MNFKIAKKTKIQKHEEGMSLVEITAIIAISVILSVIAVTSFFTLRDKHAVLKDTDSIVSMIEKIKGMSLNRKNDSSYGVVFATSTVTSYAGTSFASGNVLSVYTLENSVELRNISLTNSKKEIHFTKITGAPNATGTISVIGKNHSKTITIFGTGIIESN